MPLLSALEKALTPGSAEELNRSMIELNVKEIISMIRRYSENQIELWKQVPCWALEADGRLGYSEQLSRAYEEKLWHVHASGPPDFFVDLNNGKLVDCSSIVRPRKLKQAGDYLVFPLARYPDLLDAGKIIERLKKQTQTDYPRFTTDRTERERDEIRHRYKVPPVAI
jgi:hypothetical protein